MVHYLLIGMGGAIGALARYTINTTIQSFWHNKYPLGTYLINMIGCFVIGLLHGISLQQEVSLVIRQFLSYGILGAFTTYSTFSYEILLLYKDKQLKTALLYIAASLGAALPLLYLGTWFAQAILV